MSQISGGLLAVDYHQSRRKVKASPSLAYRASSSRSSSTLRFPRASWTFESRATLPSPSAARSQRRTRRRRRWPDLHAGEPGEALATGPAKMWGPPLPFWGGRGGARMTTLHRHRSAFRWSAAGQKRMYTSMTPSLSGTLKSDQDALAAQAQGGNAGPHGELRWKETKV